MISKYEWADYQISYFSYVKTENFVMAGSPFAGEGYLKIAVLGNFWVEREELQLFSV